MNAWTGASVGWVCAGRTTHVEGVGDDQTVEAEFSAQQPGEDRSTSSLGTLGSMGWTRARRSRSRIDIRLDRSLERGEVDLLELRAGVGDLGRAEVAVHRGVPVPREMLCRRDATVVVTVDLRRDELGDEVGVSPIERTPITGLAGLMLTSATGA